MNRPPVVDFCCSAGGVSVGLDRAGAQPIGVDNVPQPNYPYEFVQGDALKLAADPGFMRQFDGAAGSPPCQRKSKMTKCRPGVAETYPDIIAPFRDLLIAWGGPWIIENVEGAGLPTQDDLFGDRGTMLCASMFRDKQGRRYELYRHRWFQSNLPLWAPNHPRHLKPASAAGHWKPGTVISIEGHFGPMWLAREVMDINWMTRDEMREAIPPYYYGEHLGRILLDHMTARAAA